MNRRLAFAMIAAFALGGCSTTPQLAASTSSATHTSNPTAQVSAVAVASANGRLTIYAPPPNAIVSTDSILVSGTAPAGARVVQDISLAPDQDTTADGSGNWQLVIKLQEGLNELTFRIGDNATTEVHLIITYTPATPTAGPTQAPTPAPTATPRPTPTPFVPTPAPTRTFVTFGDGSYVVGTDIKAGTYRLRDLPAACYWERLKGFSGDLGDIIANDNADNAWAIVTIKSTDKGFDSDGCDEWSSDLSRVTASKTRLEDDGTYIVGTDLTAGTWRATGGDFCYWARLRGFGGTLADIIANDNVFGHSVIVTIRSTDRGFESTGCGTWTRS